MKGRFVNLFFLGCLSFQSSIVMSQTPFKLNILARVADTSLSNRDMVLYWLLQNPKSYVRGQRNYFSKEVENTLLQEKIIQILVVEEARIVGSKPVSDEQVEKELNRIKREFSSRWNMFLLDFEVSNLDIKNILAMQMLVDRTLNLRMQDAIKTTAQGEDSFQKAEDSIQSWLQQLRSRYKVHVYLKD